MHLSLFHDQPSSEPSFDPFITDDVLARLRALDARAERKGLDSLDPRRNRLIPLGTEIDAGGRVTKNSYGVFHLSWRAAKDGDWASRVRAEIAEIRAGIQAAHKTKLRFLVWAGMGGSAAIGPMWRRHMPSTPREAIRRREGSPKVG